MKRAVARFGPALALLAVVGLCVVILRTRDEREDPADVERPSRVSVTTTDEAEPRLSGAVSPERMVLTAPGVDVSASPRSGAEGTDGATTGGVEGLVRLEGSGVAVAGAKVSWVASNAPTKSSGTTTTDEAGHFRVVGLPSDTYQLTFLALPHAVLVVNDVLVERGRTAELTVDLGSGAEIVVHVSGSADTGAASPVADAAVEVVAASEEHLKRLGATARHARTLSATTDATGTGHLSGVPLGEVLLRVHSANHRPWSQTLTVEPGVERIDVVLEAGARLFGRVLDAGGEPAPGVHVFLAPPRDFAGDPLTYYREPYHQTDGEGRFDFRGLPAGIHFVVAAGTGGRLALGAPQGVALAPGEERSIGLQLLPRSSVRGRVLDADGRGIAGVGVGIRPIRLHVPGPSIGRGVVIGEVPELWDDAWRRSVTGENGEFVVEGVVTVGERATVRAIAAGYMELREERAVAEILAPEGLTLTLRRSAPAITGRVVGPSSEAQPRIPLVAMASAGGASTPRHFGTTDEGGRFAIEVPAGESQTYMVAPDILHMGRVGYTTEPTHFENVAPGASDLTFRVVPLDRLRGVVVDAETGAPVTTFEVTFFSDVDGGFRPNRLIVDDLGRFDVPFDRERDLFARFVARDHEPFDLRGIEVRVDRETTNALERGRDLVGRVVDSEGAPVVDARVCIATLVADSPYGPSSAFSAVSVTDSDGRFQLRGVPRQGLPTLAIRGNRPDLPALTFRELAAAEVDEDIAIVLPKTYDVRVDIVTIAGTSPAGRVGVFDDEGRSLNPSSEPAFERVGGSLVPSSLRYGNGVLECRLPEGTYELMYAPPSARSEADVIAFRFTIDSTTSGPLQFVVTE
jgi:hypothetical protein